MSENRGMQNKTIKKVLNKKISEWLDSIDDQELRVRIGQNLIVTGGSIASMMMGEKVNDFDFYFRDKQTTLDVARYYVDKFIELNDCNNVFTPEVREETLKNIKGQSEERVVIWVQSAGSIGEKELERDESGELIIDEDGESEKPKYRPVFLSENAITLSNKVQLITRFYGEPDKIHDNYDFVHATCYYDYGKGILHTPVEAIRSMQSKTLYYRGSLYPVCSLFRIRKFINRGWTISAGDILKIALQISQINLLDIKILREQLTGVDQLYFSVLINALKDSDGDKLSVEYISEIIDRIFGDVIK